MSVRAKFMVESVTETHSHDPNAVNLQVKLRAVVSGPGNAEWSKWTPNGELSMQITNPEICGFFRPGREYFLNIEDASGAVGVTNLAR